MWYTAKSGRSFQIFKRLRCLFLKARFLVVVWRSHFHVTIPSGTSLVRITPFYTTRQPWWLNWPSLTGDTQWETLDNPKKYDTQDFRTFIDFLTCWPISEWHWLLREILRRRNHDAWRIGRFDRKTYISVYICFLVKDKGGILQTDNKYTGLEGSQKRTKFSARNVVSKENGLPTKRFNMAQSLSVCAVAEWTKCKWPQSQNWCMSLIILWK